ncbi:MAG: sensor protein [Gemmatimonadetes bacterium]|nr:sensor protein [Gemmatimonadota bacterium]
MSGTRTPLSVSYSASHAVRERDQLVALHHALIEVERASTLEARLRVLVHAIRGIGFGRVIISVRDDDMNTTHVVSTGLSLDEERVLRTEATPGHVWRRRLEELGRFQISQSYYLDSRDAWIAWEFNDALPSHATPRPDGWASRDSLFVPLRGSNHRIVATLLLDDPVDGERPSISRVQTVELFGQQVAAIIERARLQDGQDAERRQSEALAEVTRAVSESLDLDEVMRLILAHARALMRADGATISTLCEGELEVVATNGDGDRILGARLPVEGSLSGRAMREATFMICNDAPSANGVFHQTRITAAVERVVCVPLLTARGPVGVLSVFNRDRDFTEDDARVLFRLADSVAVTLVNARLFDELQVATRAQQALAERYRNLVESAADAIFTLDPQGRLSSVNRSLEEGLEIPRARLLGMGFAELVDARDHAKAESLFRQTMSGKNTRGELRWLGQSSEPRYGAATTAPIIEDGQVTGALIIVRDTTEERRLTEQLMQQEKLAAVGQLVSGVAHELNNPLASVLAFTQLLLAGDSPLAPDQGQALETIQQEAKRAARIVGNLLTFARQHQPERTITDLNRVVTDTLELRLYGLRLQQVEVEVELDQELPLTWADPFQLQQVVLNLLVNAEQALASWNGPKRLFLRTSRRKKLLFIEVSDTGPGIPTENRSRIFNPFFTTKPVGEGTGLGLSISDGIIREHNGAIRVSSQPGQGARFVIELPHVPC